MNLREMIRQIVLEEANHVLADVEWRHAQVLERERALSQPRGIRIPRRVTAEDMNLSRHLLTGYTVTNNQPVAGSITWASLHIVYQGVDYAITGGNTALKYVYWVKATSTTTLQTSNTKPTLGTDDILVFVNNGGTAVVMASDSNQSLPMLVGNAAVDASAIATGAVGTTALATGAVTSSIIANGAVTQTQIGANAVGTGQLANGAVGATQIANNAVGTTQLANGAVGATQIANGAITATQVSATAGITGTQLAANTIGSGQLGANAVTSTAIASGAVGTTQLAAGAVTSAAVGAGAISATNLNILAHILY